MVLLAACNTPQEAANEEEQQEDGTEVENDGTASTDEEESEENENGINEEAARAFLPLNKSQQSEYYSPILGLAEDYPRGTSLDTIEKDFALMNQYGISDIRVSIAWGDYEQNKHLFDWWLLDSYVDLAEQYGITLYPYIAYSPQWATGSDWTAPPLDYQDWYDFVYTVVDRYKDRIKQWELWNEGDNSDFWTGTWDQQRELVKVGAQAVKDADPEARTVFGGLTKLDKNHVRSIYRYGADENLDVINIHFYNETWNPAPTEQIFHQVKEVADVIREYGGTQELWVAEIGYSDYVQEDGVKVSDWVRKNTPYEKTREFQAETFLRSYSLIAATEDVSTILWYEVKNLRLDSVAIGDVNNYFLGALDHNYFPKHLWFSIAATKQLFADPFKAITYELDINNMEAERPYVYGFERENGDVLVVAWNRGEEVETIEVAVPGTFKSAISHSVTGEKTAFEFDQSGDAATITLELNPEKTNTIELITGDLPARVTIADHVVSQEPDGTYTVKATATNIGEQAAENVTGEIFVNDALQLTEEEDVIIVGQLAPGEEVELSWNFEKVDSEDAPQLWIAINPKDSPAAATLIEVE